MKYDFMVIIGIVGSFVASLFGGWDSALTTLLIFMGVDYITGLIVAGVFHNSGKSKTLLMVLIACRLDLVMGTSFVRDAVVIAYIVNECISIIENAGLMGLPIPAALTRAIDVLKQKSEKEGD